MERRINLTQPENWNKNLAPLIAFQLGYVLNKRFIIAVRDFGKHIRKSHETEPIKVFDFLPVLGARYLAEYKPPLKKERKPTLVKRC